MDDDVYMFVRVELSPYSGTDFFHITGYFVTREFDRGEWAPRGLGSTWVHDEQAKFQDLAVTCQGDLRPNSDGEFTEPYAWSFGYHQPHSVTLDWAKLMVKTLSGVERKMSKMDVELGRALTFDQYLVRVGKAMGVKGYGFHALPRRLEVTGERFTWCNASEVAFQINERVNGVREPYAIKEA